MGKLTHRKLSNEEALRKYGTGSFVFVGGTGLVPEKLFKDSEENDQESPRDNLPAQGDTPDADDFKQ